MPTDILDFPARVVVTPTAARIVLAELSGVREWPMIIRMTTTSRPQQRYDHRLRDLVQHTGDLTIATNLGVPRSTAMGGAPSTVVVSLEGRGPRGGGAAAGDPEAAATRREATSIGRRSKVLTIAAARWR